jgi:hypothetical protein
MTGARRFLLLSGLLAMAVIALDGVMSSPAAGNVTCHVTVAMLATGRQLGATRHVDIDGDRRRDVVRIVEIPKLSRLCRYLLVTRVAGRSARIAPINQAGLENPSAWPPAGAPKILGFASIDRQHGAEILIKTWNGGSGTGFVAVYSLHGASLGRFKIDKSLEVADTFAYGGSARHQAGIDCFRGRGSGYVMAEGADLYSTRVRIEKQVFRARGFRFILRSTRRQTLQQRGESFHGPFFGHCAVR